MASPLVRKRPRRAAAAAAEKMTARMYNSPYQEEDAGEGKHPFYTLGTRHLLTIDASEGAVRRPLGVLSVNVGPAKRRRGEGGALLLPVARRIYKIESEDHEEEEEDHEEEEDEDQEEDQEEDEDQEEEEDEDEDEDQEEEEEDEDHEEEEDEKEVDKSMSESDRQLLSQLAWETLSSTPTTIKHPLFDQFFPSLDAIAQAFIALTPTIRPALMQVLQSPQPPTINQLRAAATLKATKDT